MTYKDLAFGNVPEEVSDEDDNQNYINFIEFTKELSENIKTQILSTSICKKSFS